MIGDWSGGLKDLVYLAMGFCNRGDIMWWRGVELLGDS